MNKKKDNIKQEKTLRENKFNTEENTRSGSIMECAIRGAIPCPKTECDGLNRMCSKWVNHSAR